MRVGVKCYFDPHDIWMGAYWKRATIPASFAKRTTRSLTTIYLCPFFCFVIRVTIMGKERVL